MNMLNGLLAAMAVEHIIALSLLGVFAVLLFIFLIIYICTLRRNAKQMNEINKMYNDKNLTKMDYDFTLYDEDGEPAENVVSEASGGAEEDTGVIFGRVDTEGIEEITGNYKPE